MRTHNYFGIKHKEKREIRDKFLIVCEGEQTEPNYFEKFPINKEVIQIDVKGEGKNTDSLVEKAIYLKAKAVKEKQPYLQVWVVFDRDSFPVHNFKRAIQLCDNHKIRYAVTNEAFELWYLLHFSYHDSAMNRTQYADKLTDNIGKKYEKKQVDTYELLKDKQEKAINWALKLRKYQVDQAGYFDPCNQNPITTVYELVEILNKYIES